RPPGRVMIPRQSATVGTEPNTLHNSAPARAAPNPPRAHHDRAGTSCSRVSAGAAVPLPGRAWSTTSGFGAVALSGGGDAVIALTSALTRTLGEWRCLFVPAILAPAPGECNGQAYPSRAKGDISKGGRNNGRVSRPLWNG